MVANSSLCRTEISMMMNGDICGVRHPFVILVLLSYKDVSAAAFKARYLLNM